MYVKCFVEGNTGVFVINLVLLILFVDKSCSDSIFDLWILKMCKYVVMFLDIGVSQEGNVLGPLLFLFLDNLFKLIDCMISVYADDIFILVLIKCSQTKRIKDLNKNLHIIFNGHLKLCNL